VAPVFAACSRQRTAYTRRMPVYVFWFGAALALLVLELVSTTFYSVFLAAGAFAAGVLAFAFPEMALWIQAVVAIVVAMLGVVLGRPLLSRRLRRHGEGPLTPGVHGGFVGQRALALDEIGEELHPGHVRLAGEVWLAYSDDHQPIATGAPVIVTAVRGTTLAVRPASGPAAPEA
jgi:membrane protein implicated in regulation of membrane protease activity